LVLAIAAVGCSQSTVGEVSAVAVHPELWPAVESEVPRDPVIEDRVDELLGRMSLAEKVGQVIQAEIRHVTPEDVREFRLGSVLNGGGSFPGNDKYATPADWLALADAFWEASMDTPDGGQPIPILWGIDAVHGHNNVIGATLFPHNIGLGATHNPALIRRIGEVTAAEVAVTGQDWTFAPTLAVVRDDRWGRTYEGYSEDPEIVRAYAGEMVRGLQGEVGNGDFLAGGRVIATAKHFLGDGGTVGGVDQGDNLASEAELRDVHGAGYVTALEAGAQTVMASFNGWHGRKMHGVEELLTGVLKERMGFDGFVVGDWNGHGQVEGCTNDNCAASFNAGVDMFMVPEDWKVLYANTLAQVESGEIAMERLDDAVRRILRVKMRAGLFTKGKPSSRPLAGETALIGAAEHRAVARQAARESLVLLKNNGGLLPLDGAQRVLVAGDGADDVGKQSGGWTISWQGTGNERSDFPGATSIWDGVREAVEGVGGTAMLSVDGSYEEKPDVAVVVFGEEPYAEFQGDRETLEYQPEGKRDLELLRELQAAGIPVVSIFLSGRPLWVNPEINASQAFVAAWLPGTEGGAIADVLFRAGDGATRHEFRGKLSFSWPRTAAQSTLNRGDAEYDPLFPYGFGLTYADDVELTELSEDSGVVAPRSDTVYFEGGPRPPWQLYVGDEADWSVLAAGSSATTEGSENLTLVAIDRRGQEDARSLRWSGAEMAQVYLQAADPIDLSRESNGDMALAFDVLVEEPPASTVHLRMDCGYPCSGSVDLSGTLAGLPPGSWRTIRVRLRCFEEAGADMSRIDTPFAIATDGALALGLSDVKLVSAADGEAICP
jgi:beta-glucosidase